MAKKQISVVLTGVLEDGMPAKPNQTSLVVRFVGASLGNPEYFSVVNLGDKVELTTPKDVYSVPFNTTLNLFKGMENNTKLHIILKKITGRLIYWA